MSARTIHLRRPPVLQALDQPFVPECDAAMLEEIDRRWEARRAANPALHDGRLTHVIGVHRNGHGGATLHTADCAYRYHAVQDDAFDLGVRPLGVKGIVERDKLFLLGRRAWWVAAYGGMWEFAPGGVVEPGREPADVISAELMEETGLACARSTPVAIVFDDVLRTWEIAFRLEARGDELDASSGEYDALQWFGKGTFPAPLTPVAKQMVGLV